MTLRLLHFTVQPVLVNDDGEQLSVAPPLAPQTLSLAGLRDLLDNWPDHLAALQKQTDEPAT